jgi:hypothetical protein
MSLVRPEAKLVPLNQKTCATQLLQLEMVYHVHKTVTRCVTDNKLAIVEAAPMLEEIAEPILDEHNSKHFSDTQKGQERD